MDAIFGGLCKNAIENLYIDVALTVHLPRSSAQGLCRGSVICAALQAFVQGGSKAVEYGESGVPTWAPVSRDREHWQR